MSSNVLYDSGLTQKNTVFSLGNIFREKGIFLSFTKVSASHYRFLLTLGTDYTS